MSYVNICCAVPRESVAEEATLPLCEWSSDESGGKLQSSPSISNLKHKYQKQNPNAELLTSTLQHILDTARKKSPETWPEKVVQTSINMWDRWKKTSCIKADIYVFQVEFSGAQL